MLHTLSPRRLPPLIQLEHVRVTLQGVPVLADISLTIRKGEHLALLGSNGAGKSTLLKIMRGELRPDQPLSHENNGPPSRVLWFPNDTAANEAALGDDAPLAGRAMTALLSPGLQEHYLRQGWNINGEELVIAGLYDDHLLYREPTSEQQSQCAALAEALNVLPLLGKPLVTLSQGQLRALLLLRALIRRPRLLLLDEAADGLDTPTRRAFLTMLENLATQPHAPTMVYTSHRSRLPSFFRFCARMADGRLISLSPIAEKVVDTAPATTTISGSPATIKTKKSAKFSPHFYIHFCNATVFIDRVEVLHAINWHIGPGEQWIVLGGNGAGKSTLLRAIMGEELVAYGGELTRYLPRHGGENPALPHIQRGIRLVSDRLQALYTYNDSAAEVVFSGFDGSIGLYRDISDDAKAFENVEVARCLALVGMSALADRPFRRLSTGQARRVLLARALVGNPELILLDEPFSGLDTDSRAAITAILESRIADGLQVILVSHHAEDALPSITHVARMESGNLTVEKRP